MAQGYNRGQTHSRRKTELRRERRICVEREESYERSSIVSGRGRRPYQLQRVTGTFTAPSKTFEDIKRGNRSWWLPFIILALSGYLFFAAVQQKIGMQQVVDNQIRMNAKAQEQMAAGNAGTA